MFPRRLTRTPSGVGLVPMVLALALGACSGDDSIVAPVAPEEDLVQTITVRPGTLTIVGSCDHDSPFESSGNGEFALRFSANLDGSEERTSFSLPEQAWNEGAHDSPGGNLSFTRNVTQGEDFVLRFSGTEYDGLLGADEQFRSVVHERIHLPDSNGRWVTSGLMTLPGSKAQCEVTLSYSITWARR